MLDSSAVATTPGWPRWGGPGGDFKVVVAGLAESWPEDGPPVLWRRPLGAGYSAIAAVAGTLYTIYRDGEDDVVIALRADDGETVWEHRYRAPTREGNSLEFGKGPHATPLILADRLVTLGYTGVLSCLDRKTGEPIWTHDLIPDFEGEVLEFGYSASPILQDGKVIVLVGGSRHARA
jgi:outer membrane protein assembly factor BamB